MLANKSVIQLAATKNALLLFSQTPDIGDIQNEVPLVEMRGVDFTISLNAKLLVDLLRSIGSGKVRLRFAGKLKPLVILPENIDSSTLFLITPIKTH